MNLLWNSLQSQGVAHLFMSVVCFTCRRNVTRNGTFLILSFSVAYRMIYIYIYIFIFIYINYSVQGVTCTLSRAEMVNFLGDGCLRDYYKQQSTPVIVPKNLKRE